MNKSIIAKFDYKKWHSLTDFVDHNNRSDKKTYKTNDARGHDQGQAPIPVEANNKVAKEKNIFDSLSSNTAKVLYDIALYPHLSVTERKDKLNLSGRAITNSVHELATVGLVIESKAGKKKFFMPKPEVFEHYGILCPYPNTAFIEHSFYLWILKPQMRQKKSIKSATLEYKIGTSGHTADIVTLADNGTLIAYELTLSASNIIQNCMKYNKTAFKKIIFLCKSTDLLKATKSTVLNGGLPLELLSKIDFVLLSSVIKKSR